jgi:hypothetical protein
MTIPGVQMAERRILEPSGYEIVTTADGGIAMNMFRATVPRVVVLDLCLTRKFRSGPMS